MNELKLRKLKLQLNSTTNRYQQLGILLVANRMLNDYISSAHVFLGTEPEAFAESWMNAFVMGNKVFKDDIIRVFINMLQDVNNNVK